MWLIFLYFRQLPYWHTRGVTWQFKMTTNETSKLSIIGPFKRNPFAALGFSSQRIDKYRKSFHAMSLINFFKESCPLRSYSCSSCVAYIRVCARRPTCVVVTDNNNWPQSFIPQHKFPDDIPCWWSTVNCVIIGSSYVSRYVFNKYVYKAIHIHNNLIHLCNSYQRPVLLNGMKEVCCEKYPWHYFLWSRRLSLITMHIAVYVNRRVCLQ